MQPFIVNKVVFPETKLIDENGQFNQSVPVYVAINKAKEVGLDLVCFNKPDKGETALCKIIDFGKWKYHQEKILKQEKKKSKIETKEVRFTPVIGEHDIEHKVKQIIEFLDDGDYVVLTMKFKGIHHRLKDEGKRIVNEVIDKCKEKGKELSRKQDNNNITVRLGAL